MHWKRESTANQGLKHPKILHGEAKLFLDAFRSIGVMSYVSFDHSFIFMAGYLGGLARDGASLR